MLEKGKKIGRFLELNFRALPRFGAFEATQTKISEFRPLFVLYHSSKFESNISIRLGGDKQTRRPSKNQKNDDISKPEGTSSKQKKLY